jgi:hypothetical protein
MASGGQPQFRYTQPPSKVLHLRNLPWDCTPEELVELGTPFGKVVNTKCGVGANRNQAFIEFVSTTSFPPPLLMLASPDSFSASCLSGGHGDGIT